MMLKFQTNFRPSSATVKKHELLPDFLIIGAGKSGTTSLDRYLQQHPEIFIPAMKEPNFYGYENKGPEDFMAIPGDLDHYKNSVTNLEDYLRLFKNAKPFQVKGETSNSYMYMEESAARIRAYNPAMKIIAVLRQPAARLYSRYFHLLRENRLPVGTRAIEDCKNASSVWWQRNDLIKEGFYHRHLLPYYQLFPEKNIRVYLFEEFNADPQRLLKDIYSFLGVDKHFEADLSIRYNQSGIIRNKFLDGLYGHHGILLKSLKFLLPSKFYSKMTNSMLVQKAINILRERNLTKPEINPEIYNWLTHTVYKHEIQNLSMLIKKDLSGWLKDK